ncbi:MAG: 4-alpha-glucanotransferase [Puniceicoccales bacterium]|jgi:4-alpha-glucanotransferase|nr:4-alpha-glucanotransferase [Puniceicoccales bacterium]
MTEITFQERKRSVGIMMHVSCLPSRQGIGCFNEMAFRFIDFLANAGVGYWQICPLNPTSYGDSPYQGISVFAINPYFLDLETLDIRNIPPDLSIRSDRVSFGRLYEYFNDLLENFGPSWVKIFGKDVRFLEFQRTQAHWLRPYALFASLKHFFNGKAWFEWPQEYKIYKKIDYPKLPDIVIKYFECHEILQYILHIQWQKIKHYAHQCHVKMIGDIPIYPGLDSADVWSEPENFQLDKQLNPKKIAGVPPDYFSPEGQLWGNPIYNWKFLQQNQYDWWQRRVQRNGELFDVLRLDHFRGFDHFWTVPAGAENAINGKWEAGPGKELFDFFKNNEFIAEDLGAIDDSARQLQRDLNFPGMKVLQFAFSGDSKNIYLPHHHDKNAILYLGTHDNDTLRGWYAKLDENAKDQIRRYFGIDNHEIVWNFLMEIYRSPCFLSIVCVPDLLELSSEARFNTPGIQGTNWQWRMTEEQFIYLETSVAEKLNVYKVLYDR